MNATPSATPGPGTGARSVTGTRLAARTAAAVVALVAGAASFEHIASVAIAAGERAWVGYSLPFAIDGLIVVGVAALVEDQRQRRHPRASARLAVLVGVVATLAANVASAQPTMTARLVALTAPVSFLLAVEVLTRSGRHLSTPDDTPPTTTPAPVAVDTPAPEPPTQPAATRKPRRRPSARQRVVAAVAQRPEATAAEIAAHLGLSERTVQRYRPTPGSATPPPPDSSPSAVSGDVAPVPADAFSRNHAAEVSR